jgi:DNA-binding SARP family transcriptional activator/tetratricopeptide (TPR) repeat protein
MVALEFRLLGEVAVLHRGRAVDLGHARQRCVLAVLLVDAGRVVPVDVLLDRVWADSQPRRARNALSGYVSRLRQVLAVSDEAKISRVEGGYRLAVDLQSVDLHRFRGLVAQARAAITDGAGLDRFKQALGLWQGSPFAALDTPWLCDMRTAIEAERFAAVLDRNDLALRDGRHADLLGELSTWADAYPLDERLAGQLMYALHRSGRQADALRHYELIRSRLANELGTDPSSPLRKLHSRILNADPTLDPLANPPGVAEPGDGPAAATAMRTPRQLPRDLPTFVSRDHELADLVALLEAEAASTMGPVVVLHGAPGVGKSALATHAAHLSASRFPDGQLHVNLRGATPGVTPLLAGKALHQLLRSLGVAGTDMPAGVDEAAALLRTVVAERRLLIVLDNAASAAQVRPLLPGCAVLVTSRTRLATLEGATHLHIGPLNPDAAFTMLNGLISEVRPAAEPEATRRLAELCDYLPLGLHVAAARLNARPTWTVSELVDRLADERHRLTELAAGDIALRSSLAVSHTTLHDSDNPTDQQAARALCLFGLLPITDVDLDLAAAVFDTSQTDIDRTIERLLDAHLVEEIMPGRFHMHDLTRLFAHEIGADTIPPTEQRTAVTSLMSHYLATTCRANALVYPHRVHHPAPEVTTPPKPLASQNEALRWLEEQHHNMLSAIQQAWSDPTEHVRLGVALALALHWYQFLHSGVNDLPDRFLHELVRATERLGDRRSQAHAHCNLAAHLSRLGQLDQARAHSSAELAICREIGDRFGEQRALGNLGYTCLAQHRPEQAIGYLQQQFDLARDVNAPLGEAFALVNLGKAHHQLGRSTMAITMIEKGLAWYEKTGDHYRQCDAHEVLARIHIDLSQYDRAIALMTHGLDQARHIGYRFGEIWALTTLAQAHRLSGNIDKARYYAEQSIRISNNLDGTQARTDALTEYARLPPTHIQQQI